MKLPTREEDASRLLPKPASEGLVFSPPYSFISLPLSLVVADQHLIIQSIDLDWNGTKISRENEHAPQCLIIKKAQTRRCVLRRLEGLQSRQRKSPNAERRHSGVVGFDVEARRFDSFQNAPVRVAREQWRRTLYSDGGIGREVGLQQAIE